MVLSLRTSSDCYKFLLADIYSASPMNFSSWGPDWKLEKRLSVLAESGISQTETKHTRANRAPGMGYFSVWQIVLTWKVYIQCFLFANWKIIRLCDFFFSFCCTRAWIQGLHLEPLHQPLFCDGFFWDTVSWTICPGWLRTTILLISASWVT
jgi:hypothetical protein